MTTTVIFVVIFFVVLIYVLVLLRTREDASIFTASIVTTYISYLSWSGLASHSEYECNPMIGSAANTTSQIVVGFVFTFVVLFVVSSLSKDAKSEQ